MLDVKFLGANGSVQENGSLNTSLLISDGGTSVLVDASSNIFEAVESDIDALFITHNHIDHMYGLPSLIHQMWLTGRQKTLDIICPFSLIQMVENLMGVFAIRSKKNMFDLNVIPAENHRYGTLTFDTFKTDHTDDSFGLVIRDAKNTKVVYTADSRPIIDARPQWINADILIHEASGSKESEEVLIKKGHSSAYDAALLARNICAKRLILCHLPKGNDAKLKLLDEAKSVFQESYLPSIIK